MALPTPQQQADVVQEATSFFAGLLQSKLGVSLDPSALAAVLEVAVDSLCMKAWKQAHAAGQAAAANITTEAQAEAAQRQP